MSYQCYFCPDGDPATTDPCMECGLPVCGKCTRGDAEWLCVECYAGENFGDCVDDYLEDDQSEGPAPDCDCFDDEEDE